MSCEYVLWHGNVSSVWFPGEPCASGSGLILSILAIFGPPIGVQRLPPEFWFANASLFWCGICTFLYHAFDADEHKAWGININILDYMSMALVVGSTSILFLEPHNQYMGYYVLVAYLIFAAYANDSVSYQWLRDHTDNKVHLFVLYPLFILPYVFMLYHIISIYDDWHILVTCIATAILSWIIDQWFCIGINALAFAHSMWHLSIGYAGCLFICYALRKRGIVLEGSWWPTMPLWVYRRDDQDYLWFFYVA